MPNPEKPSPVSEAELELLKSLWERGPSTVRELHKATPSRAYTTVQTLLFRLEEKGCVRVDRSGLAHVFVPVVTREELLDRRLSQIADELCDGAATPLILRLVEGKQMTSEDIARFRALLDAAEPEEDA